MPESHTSPALLRRRYIAGWLVLVVVPLAGCRICADCDPEAYPAYGGVWERTNRDSGRVGSIFDPAGARDAALFSRDQPLPIDELERKRQQQDGDQEPTPARTDEPREQETETTNDIESVRFKAGPRAINLFVAGAQSVAHGPRSAPKPVEPAHGRITRICA